MNPLETSLPTNTVISAAGATADILKQEYPNKKNALKRAKKPDFNKLLENEYTVLLILGSAKDCPKSIPKVFEDFPPRDLNDVYSFQEELLDGYKPLFDRDNKAHARDALSHLSEFDRVIVLDELRRGFEYANNEGFIYGDVQLDNTMVKGEKSSLEVKIPDWGLVQKIDKRNHLQDVQQLATMIPQLFDGVSIPLSIETWMNRLQKGRITDYKTAWYELHLAAHEYIYES